MNWANLLFNLLVSAKIMHFCYKMYKMLIVNLGTFLSPGYLQAFLLHLAAMA